MSLRSRATRGGAVVAIVAACLAIGRAETRAQEPDALSRRAADRVKALRDEADRLASEARTVLGDLRRLELQREIRTEEFRQAERDAAQVARELGELDRQIVAIEQQEQAEGPELQARLVSLYKLGRGRYVRLLLSTSDVRRIGQASRMVGLLASQDQDRIATHHRRLQELTATRQTLRERQSRLAVLRDTTSRARRAAEDAVAARNALISEIDQRRDLNAQLASEMVTAQEKLQTTLSDVAAGSTSAPPSLPIGPFRGDLDWPVAGTIRQRFGSGGRALSMGIDIAANEGDAVHAIHDGVVAFADVFSGFGRLVIVDHGGRTFSLYGNLKDIEAGRGTTIGRGDAIGTVGVAATGATGLYFELRIDGRPVDPLQWLKNR